MNLEENNDIFNKYLKKEILNLPEISEIFINNLLKNIYTNYLLFNVNLYYQTNIYKEIYFEYFLIYIIININTNDNNIIIIKLKKILDYIKNYLLLKTNTIFEKNYKKIIDYINITNIFHYLCNKLKDNNYIKYFNLNINNLDHIFNYYFNLLKNKLNTLSKINDNNNDYNDILNYIYIYKIINEKNFKYNINVSDIKNEIYKVINNNSKLLIYKNENEIEINNIFDNIKIIKLNKLNKIIKKKKIKEIENKKHFLFIKFKKTKHNYILIGGTNTSSNNQNELNSNELTRLKKYYEDKINKIKEKITKQFKRGDPQSDDVIKLGHDLIILDTKYQHINSLLHSISANNIVVISGVTPNITQDEIKLYKNIYQCITKKKISNKIININNNNNNNENDKLSNPIFKSYILNYKCVINKKKYFENNLSDFKNNKIILESKIEAIPDNDKSLFNENIIQNITRNIIFNVERMTTLKGTAKEFLLKKINEIIEIDLKINNSFKKMVVDISKLVEDITSDFMLKSLNNFKKKLVKLQKNLFLFQVRTIFNKFTQITNIMTQNLDPIYDKHNDEKYMLLNNFKGLVDVIDNKITKMNDFINDSSNENSKIKKYSIETDSSGNMSMKTEIVEQNKLKDTELLYIQSMNSLNNNNDKSLDLGINQELTKYESFIKSSEIIYHKNIEKYDDYKIIIDKKEIEFEAIDITNDTNKLIEKIIIASELYKEYNQYLYIQEQLINSSKNYYHKIDQYIQFIRDFNPDVEKKNIKTLECEKKNIENKINEYTCRIRKSYYIQKKILFEQKIYFNKYKETKQDKFSIGLSIPDEDFLDFLNNISDKQTQAQIQNSISSSNSNKTLDELITEYHDYSNNLFQIYYYVFDDNAGNKKFINLIGGLKNGINDLRIILDEYKNTYQNEIKSNPQLFSDSIKLINDADKLINKYDDLYKLIGNVINNMNNISYTSNQEVDNTINKNKIVLEEIFLINNKIKPIYDEILQILANDFNDSDDLYNYILQKLQENGIIAEQYKKNISLTGSLIPVDNTVLIKNAELEIIKIKNIASNNGIFIQNEIFKPFDDKINDIVDKLGDALSEIEQLDEQVNEAKIQNNIFKSIDFQDALDEIVKNKNLINTLIKYPDLNSDPDLKEAMEKIKNANNEINKNITELKTKLIGTYDISNIESIENKVKDIIQNIEDTLNIDYLDYKRVINVNEGEFNKIKSKIETYINELKIKEAEEERLILEAQKAEEERLKKEAEKAEEERLKKEAAAKAQAQQQLKPVTKKPQQPQPSPQTNPSNTTPSKPLFTPLKELPQKLNDIIDISKNFKKATDITSEFNNLLLNDNKTELKGYIKGLNLMQDTIRNHNYTGVSGITIKGNNVAYIEEIKKKINAKLDN